MVYNVYQSLTLPLYQPVRSQSCGTLHVNDVGNDKNSSDHNYITFRSTGITNLARPSFMDIIKTDWDAYEAQLADNMTNLTDSFSNLDSSDKVDKAADLLSQSIVEAFNSATDFTYVS